MDNLNGDMVWKPDPPGDEVFVVWHFDAHHDCAGLMSTMTDPPPSESPSDKQCASLLVATRNGAWSYNNDKDNIVDLSSNDWLIKDNHLSSPHDESLMSMTFP